MGEHLAHAFAAQGAAVVVAARTEANVARIAHEITAKGGRALGLKVDGTVEADVLRMVDRALREYQRIDILVNLAGGLTRYKPVAEMTVSDWEEELRNNLTTAFLCSRAVIKPMAETKRGKIINFASAGGLSPMAQMAPYNCAKAGVIALTKTLALELKKHNIHVNAVAPGLIQTQANLEAMKPSPEDLEKKWVSREAVANAVLFLASGASDGITGQVIPVMGKGI
jgi:NAD(P)-dependent dehydrogenase (short-subunit alcohol dehydrogenase family)